MQVPQRLLMGPGPANAHPRVLAAQSLPLLGHMHPPFFKIMDEMSEGLRYVFQTDSKYTLMVSGTGHAGMEAAVANLLEPGEKIIVGNKGIWGERVADLAARYGGEQGLVTHAHCSRRDCPWQFHVLPCGSKQLQPQVLHIRLLDCETCNTHNKDTFMTSCGKACVIASCIVG